jgi:hypothetical protein
MILRNGANLKELTVEEVTSEHLASLLGQTKGLLAKCPVVA